MEKKKCLECGEAFNGRADKKFCSDLCRNAHNNKLNSDHVNYVRNINNILRKNRRIIENLLPEETAKVSHQKLIDKGFNFNYFTNITTTKTGKNYTFCYEFGYLPIEGNYYLLVKRKTEL
jgi:predicted nucleic acid-binding Zn ribbon protein